MRLMFVLLSECLNNYCHSILYRHWKDALHEGGTSNTQTKQVQIHGPQKTKYNNTLVIL